MLLETLKIDKRALEAAKQITKKYDHYLLGEGMGNQDEELCVAEIALIIDAEYSKPKII